MIILKRDINLKCRFFLILTALVIFSSCFVLADASINGSNSMSTSSSQTLSVIAPDGGSVYSWEISSGGGALSQENGTSVTYNSSDTNANCTNNAQITLKKDGVAIDKFGIAANAYSGSEQAYGVLGTVTSSGCGSCAGQKICYNCKTSSGGNVSCSSEDCCGAFQSSDPNDASECIGIYGCYCTWDTWLYPYESMSEAWAECNTCGDEGDVRDYRTPAMKSAGSCPPVDYLDAGTRCGSDGECKSGYCREDHEEGNFFCAEDNESCVHNMEQVSHNNMSDLYRCDYGEWEFVLGGWSPNDDILQKDSGYMDLSVNTRGSSNARYTTNPAYYDNWSAIENFDMTGGLTHHTIIENLSNGQDYSVCVRLNVTDTGALTDCFFINFSVSDTSLPACSSNAISYWTFDSTSGSTIYDDWGSNDGTSQNGAGSASGFVGNGFNFDGVDDYVSVSDDSTLDITDYITIAAWAKPYDTKWGGIVSKGEQFDWYGNYIFCLSGEKLSFRYRSTSADQSPQRSSEDLITEDKWQHVAVTYNYSDNESIRWFVDGVEYDALSFYGYYGYPPDTTSYPLNIGRSNDYNGPRHNFSGVLDEIAIWDRMITETEARNLYCNSLMGDDYCSAVSFAMYNFLPANNSVLAYGTENTEFGFSTCKPAICRYSTSSGQSFSSMDFFDGDSPYYHNTTISGLTTGQDNPIYIKCQDAKTGSITGDYYINLSVSGFNKANCLDGTVSYWTFDNDDVIGTTIYDVYGTNNGTALNGPSSTTGKVGQAFDFDGVDDYINMSNPSNLNFDASTSFSVVAWINHSKNNVGTYETVLAKQQSTVEGYYLYRSVANRTTFYVRAGTNVSNPRINGSDVDQTQWHFLVGVYDKTKNITSLYIDGDNKTDSREIETWGTISNSLDFLIGARSDGSQVFNGSIDEVAIFDRALTQNEILSLYNKSMDGEGYCDLRYPIASEFTDDPDTTNFSEQDILTNVTNLSLCDNGQCIMFPDDYGVNTDNQNYNDAIIFGDCFVAVNTSALDYTFNATSYLVMNNSDGHCGDDRIWITETGFPTYADQIRSTDERCPDCIILQKTNGFVTKFRVSHFTGYAIGPNTELKIFDEYEGSSADENTSIMFYANYTNRTSHQHITGANCTISFNTDPTQSQMTDSGSRYTYNLTAGFNTSGVHDFYVNCSGAPGYNQLNASDNITVGTQQQQPAVPEFSLLTLATGLMIILLGLIIIRKKDNRPIN